MKSFFLLNSILLAVSAGSILAVFLFNPLFVLLFSRSRGMQKKAPPRRDGPSVSLVTVVRNAEDLVGEKIKNSLSLQYPSQDYEIIVYSDHSTDKTLERAALYGGEHIRLLKAESHEGKNRGLNRAVGACRGEIIVFSDVDALLGKEAIIKLANAFEDPRVGGVCGQRTIVEEDRQFQEAQRDYVRFDSLVKELESRLGSITSNDGKLYALRRSLVREIDPAVTDDLYACLTILEQGYDFLFEPEAEAFIKVPSRNRAHELQRRRRIVARSLRGLYLKRTLLNPLRYGHLSVRLFVNKVLRRFLPVLLILTFLSSLSLAFAGAGALALLLPQLGFYALALAHHRHWKVPKPLRRASSTAYYFCIGNYGTLLGLLDFLRGRRIDRWEPVKKD